MSRKHREEIVIYRSEEDQASGSKGKEMIVPIFPY